MDSKCKHTQFQGIWDSQHWSDIPNNTGCKLKCMLKTQCWFKCFSRLTCSRKVSRCFWAVVQVYAVPPEFQDKWWLQLLVSLAAIRPQGQVYGHSGEVRYKNCNDMQPVFLTWHVPTLPKTGHYIYIINHYDSLCRSVDQLKYQMLSTTVGHTMKDPYPPNWSRKRGQDDRIDASVAKTCVSKRFLASCDVDA